MVNTLEASGQSAADVIAATFFDIDEFRQNLIGWDVNPVQLGTGSLVVRHEQVQICDRLLYRLRTNLKLSDRSLHRSGEIAYIVTFSGERWCGFDVPPGSLIVRGPQREHCNLLDGASDSLAIHVPDWLADEHHLPFDSSTYMNAPIDTCIYRMSELDAVKFRILADSFMTPFELGDHADEALHWPNVTYDLAVGLLGRVVGQRAGPRSAVPIVPRYDLISSALIHIDKCESLRISVEELAAAIGVSSRSLNTAFRAFLGVSPGQYLIARRLQAVRQGLLSIQGAGGAASVTELAVSQDFYHLSRFAQHYRRLFGELPSDTLHRTRPGRPQLVDHNALAMAK